VAVAVAPALSRTVRPSEWLPLPADVEFHENVVDDPDTSCAPSSVSV
jgi:hypothetical protein